MSSIPGGMSGGSEAFIPNHLWYALFDVCVTEQLPHDNIACNYLSPTA